MKPSDTLDGAATNRGPVACRRAARRRVLGSAAAERSGEERRPDLLFARLAAATLFDRKVTGREPAALRLVPVGRVDPARPPAATARVPRRRGPGNTTSDADGRNERKPQSIRRVVAGVWPMCPMARCAQRRLATAEPGRSACGWSGA